jgi:hypothetical protein
MTDGFLNIDTTGISGHASLDWGNHSDRADGTSENHLRTAVGWLPIAVMVAAIGWVLLSHTREQIAAGPSHLSAAQAKPGPSATVGLAKESSFNPLISEAIVPEQPAPVDRLTISSQSWRRGGLGSNAFVTLTLRNNNGYAVRNVELACAFSRPDGSHLTDRSRVIADVINMKSRKTFVRLHVGFVNVNAAKAKCWPVAASHV